MSSLKVEYLMALYKEHLKGKGIICPDKLWSERPSPKPIVPDKTKEKPKPKIK